MHIKKLLLFTLCCLVHVAITAQANVEIGKQIIDNFSPEEYEAAIQNWAIVQDVDGMLYFGNSFGLLQYDGTNWRSYRLPNKSVVRSLAIGDSGKIYTGAQGELGFFQADSIGRLIFHSLVNFLPKAKQDFTDVFQTYVVGNKVYFKTNNYIFIWNIQKKAWEQIISSESGFHVMFCINHTIYVREWKKGLETLKNGVLTLLKGGEQFADERIYVMLPFQGEQDKILIVTRTAGMFTYDGNGFVPFKTTANKFITDHLIYCGTILSDGNIILGTLNGGAIVINKAGEEVQRFSFENGIIDNGIYYVLQDYAGSIWLGTMQGISRIDYASPISYFAEENNTKIICKDIIRYNGIIYVAAMKGVYFLNPLTSKLNPLQNDTQESYAFIKFGKDLLLGAHDGLYSVNKNKLTAVRESIGNEYAANVITQSRLNPNRIFVGASSGLWSMLKTANGWQDKGQIVNNVDQVSTIEEEEDGSLWMGTHSSGLFRIRFQKNNKGEIILNEPAIEHFNKNNGLQDGYSDVNNFNGKFYFATQDSFYRFNERRKIFYSDTSDKIIDAAYKMINGKHWSIFQMDNLKHLWIGTPFKVSMGTLHPDNSYKWLYKPFSSAVREILGPVYTEQNGTVWLGTASGIVKYDPAYKIPCDTSYSALIRSISVNNDSIIYFGDKAVYTKAPLIEFKYNTIKFGSAATSYKGKNNNQFKTFLKGFDKGWSTWSKEVSKEYTNLPPGKYTFEVQALNIADIESKIGSYSFEILPPWYRTWWFYALYIVIFLILTWSIIKWRTEILKKEKIQLEEKVNHRTEQLNNSLNELKSTQAQLVHSAKMASLGELTAGIAHEIQNPLNFVNNFSEVNNELIEEMNNESDIKQIKTIANDIKQNNEKIAFHGKRADSIVKGMLQHSRASSGQKELTDINKLTDEYLRLSYHGMRAKDKSFNAEFKTDFDESLGKINVVPQDIGRVLLNLFNNAFYAVSKSPHPPDLSGQALKGEYYQPIVKVSTKKVGDKVEIRVADNGSGIPQNIIDKIFQPFFTTKPTGQGTGLGLSLAYDIVKAHGGEIKVETKEGEGSEFIIRLPV